jgi:hypothetical protein
MKKEWRIYLAFFLLVFLGLALPAVAQRGALTTSQNLGELLEEAHTVVQGYVTNARVEPHPQLRNLTTVVVTVRVGKVLKGEAGPFFTFRQYVWDVRDKYSAAGYRKAQHVLLLMTPPSEYGLSSPVGLEQGRFRLEAGPTGELVAVNGRNNLMLFRQLDSYLTRKQIRLAPQLETLARQHKSGPVRLEDLEEMIRSLAGGR